MGTTQPNWQPFPGSPVTVPAKPAALWTKVADYVSGPRKLKLSATGTWKARTAACDPDGDRTVPVASAALLPTALMGALIAKVGGSAADAPSAVPAGATAAPSGLLIFAVGSFCVVELQSAVKGALFLTMNDQVDGFDQHSGQVTCEIYDAL